ncbi:MAG: hypothetical protein WBV39_06785 [Rudaea sp.]
MTSKANTWRGHLATWQAGNQSIAAFCRGHALDYAQFMYWQRRLGNARNALVPVRLEGPVAATLSLELSLAQGVCLRVSGASTKDVVTLVRGLSC